MNKSHQQQSGGTLDSYRSRLFHPLITIPLVSDAGRCSKALARQFDWLWAPLGPCSVPFPSSMKVLSPMTHVPRSLPTSLLTTNILPIHNVDDTTPLATILLHLQFGAIDRPRCTLSNRLRPTHRATASVTGSRTAPSTSTSTPSSQS